MDVPNINVADIRAEAHKLAMNIQPETTLKHNDVLDEIVDNLKTVDFRKEGKLDEDEKISQKVLIVVAVQQVLRIARDLSIGLCRHANFLYSYNGAFWRLIERAELEGFLGKAAARLGVHEITSAYHKFRAELVKQFFSVAYIPAPVLPVGVVLINLLNSTFEITATARRLREFRSEDFLTYQLPFAYDEGATYPKWQKFLDKVLPDKPRQKVLAEYFAYIFTNLKLEKTLLLFGTGLTGNQLCLMS